MTGGMEGEMPEFWHLYSAADAMNWAVPPWELARRSRRWSDWAHDYRAILDGYRREAERNPHLAAMGRRRAGGA